MDLGGYLLTLARVSPGNPCSMCFLIAALNDESGGDPRVACEN